MTGGDWKMGTKSERDGDKVPIVTYYNRETTAHNKLLYILQMEKGVPRLQMKSNAKEREMLSTLVSAV